MTGTGYFAEENVVQAEGCTGQFVEHVLPFTLATSSAVVRFYESNGSGLAINDLNDDGLLDLVMGNLNGATVVLWNEGDLTFRSEALSRIDGHTRAVHTVDVEGDGWLDIVLTSQRGAPRWLRNRGDGTFEAEGLRGVSRPAYSMQWVDVDADNDLDLVAASYDAELFQLLRDSFMFGGGAGVMVYEQRGDSFEPTRLSDESQGLAMWVSDVDGDSALDLFVVNDFIAPDRHWSLRDGEWIEDELFAVTALSPMSFDVGDINNDGLLEYFVADMSPAQRDAETIGKWQYVFADLNRDAHAAGDRQRSENMLMVQRSPGEFVNQARGYGVASSGWSWSSKFGDLDQDGYLDLYVVNGMASEELFSHLPGNELVEGNIAFRNDGGRRFIPAPEWGLGSLRGGRGMSMGDLDNDGDLDIVVNNLNAPAILFENQLCSGNSLQVELRWPESLNDYGIGAQITLVTSTGTYVRDVRSGSGYLSGDPVRVHFGFPATSTLFRLEILWTDGIRTTVDSPEAGVVLTVNR